MFFSISGLQFPFFLSLLLLAGHKGNRARSEKRGKRLRLSHRTRHTLPRLGVGLLERARIQFYPYLSADGRVSSIESAASRGESRGFPHFSTLHCNLSEVLFNRINSARGLLSAGLHYARSHLLSVGIVETRILGRRDERDRIARFPRLRAPRFNL